MMEEARIDRKQTLMWNVVPAYIGDEDRIKPVSSSQVRDALPYLEELLKLLSRLEAVVLLGNTARKAKGHVEKWKSVPIYTICHPSQRVFNLWPDKKQHALDELRKVASLLAE